MRLHSSSVRKVLAALVIALPCLLWAASADAAPVRKAHSRPHKSTSRKTVAPNQQTFARMAGKHPDRRVYRHPPSWFKSAHGSQTTTGHDAAIQNDFSPASLAVYQPAPALDPLHLLVPVQAQLLSHDGFAPSSPRAPPVRG
jgi:hypothetical protein